MIQVPATISKVSSMADGGLSLLVHTQELHPESEAEVMRLKRKLGWFVFAETTIAETDIPTEKLEFKDDETLDERLNKVLFAYHMGKTNDSKSYHTFKRKVYETLIERYKNLLSELK